ncbi:MAG: hypothetical protein AB7D51_00335 [Desulfovibrionaceae bacterium]|jgi:hypothetical protein
MKRTDARTNKLLRFAAKMALGDAVLCVVIWLISGSIEAAAAIFITYSILSIGVLHLQWCLFKREERIDNE